jgi:hypothetical protein
MIVRRLITMALAALVVAGAIAQSSRSPVARWGDRLESLEPARAMAYFELAEEVADAAGTPAEHALARKLFALAGALAPESLGRSACLALADLEASETERRRLLALATLLGGPEAGELPDENDPLRDPSLEALEGLTEAFSHYRKGQGSRATSALRAEGAEALLDACDRLLPGGAARFREDCRNYRGQLRPSLSDEEFNRLLRLEIGLLARAQRPWSSELMLSRGEPLIEVDPDRLAESIGADVKHPVFRNGQWSKVR